MKIDVLNKNLKKKPISKEAHCQLHFSGTTISIKHTNYVPEEVEVRKGSVVLQIEDETYQLTAGDSILIPPATTQHWSRIDGSTDCLLAFTSLEYETLFENLSPFKKPEKKIVQQSLEVAKNYFHHELRLDSFIRTCQKYLRQFTRSAISEYVNLNC